MDVKINIMSIGIYTHKFKICNGCQDEYNVKLCNRCQDEPNVTMNSIHRKSKSAMDVKINIMSMKI